MSKISPVVWAVLGGFLMVSSSLVAPAGDAEAVELSPGGELGLRYHGLLYLAEDEGDMVVNRPELLWRLGLEAAEPEDGWSVRLFLVGAEAGAASEPWTALPEFGTSHTIGLDTAALRLSPTASGAFHLELGVADSGWTTDEILFDRDLRLPGAWLRLRQSGPPGWTEIRGSAGIALLHTGRPDGADDVYIAGLTLGSRLQLGALGDLVVDLGSFHLGGQPELARAVARGDLYGHTDGFTTNTTPSDVEDPDAELTRRLVEDGFSSDFHIASAAVTLEIISLPALPLAVFVHGTVNYGASDVAEDAIGLRSGVRFGDPREVYGGHLEVAWVRLSPDAAIEVLNRETLGTNTTGVDVVGGLRLSEGITARFEALGTTAVDEDLRALGDEQPRPISTDPPTAIRLRVSLTCQF